MKEAIRPLNPGAEFYTPEGCYIIELSNTDDDRDASIARARVEAGASYYLRVNTALKFEKDGMNTRKFWIDTVDEKTALNEIVKTEDAGPQSAQPQSAQPDQSGSETGFSVDKTQDPFAGKSR